MKIGIIGTGIVVDLYHVKGWLGIPGAEVVAVTDANVERAKFVAEKYGVKHAFGSAEELLASDVEAVDICTPNNFHHPIVMAALAAGKHVYCEKPLATTSWEIREMGKLADRQGLLLMTGQDKRYTGSAQAVKSWADKGNLGDVYHARVKATRRNWLPTTPGFIDARLSGGGPCMDIGVHALDMCLWLMGFPRAARVTGTSRVNFAKGHDIPGGWGEWDRELFSVEDFASGFVHMENGATIAIEASWLGMQTEEQVFSAHWFGSKGGVRWPTGEFVIARDRQFHDGTLQMPQLGESHAAALRAFHEAAVEGAPSPVPWTDSLAVIEILEAIYRSAAEKREIELRAAS